MDNQSLAHTKWNCKYHIVFAGRSGMDYISVQEVAKKWGISERRIQKLCEEELIPGDVGFSRMWLTPQNSKKPDDARRKEN